MLYSENGQFKTTYRADQQIFPIPQDRIAIGAAAGLRLRRRAAAGRRVPVPRHPDPVPDPVAGGAGAEHPGRLLRPDLAGHRRLHGGGRLCGLQLHGAHRRHAADRWRCCSGGVCATVVGVLFGIPVAAHQGPVPGGGHAGGAVLRRLGFPAHQVVHQRLVLGLGLGGRPERVRHAHRHAGARSTCSAWPSWSCSRCWPRTWCAATSAASGWRSATWTWPPR